MCWSPARGGISRRRPRRLDELAISARTRNRLTAAGITTVDQLLMRSHADLRRVSGLERICIAEIDGALASGGLYLPWKGLDPAIPRHEASEHERAQAVDTLRLPARLVADLAASGVTTVGHILDRTKADLLRIKGVGDRAVGVLSAQLADRGLELTIYDRGGAP